jgi:ribosomal protein S27AE
MGPWAYAIVGIAALLAVFFAVMGFRGLIDAIDQYSGECERCGRTTLLPLPLESHQCWRCHYGRRRAAHLAIVRLLVRH